MPEHQPCSSFIFDGEQLEVFAEPPMIAAKGFYFAALVFRKLLGRLPGCAVDALKLRFCFIATPVSAGDTFQFERLGVKIFGVFNMGARTKIPPLIPKCVEGDRLLEPLQDFEFVRLVLGFDPFLCLISAHLDPLEGQLAPDDFAHLLLDGL